MLTLLILGYYGVIDASQAITEEDLSNAHCDTSIRRKFLAGPLRDLMFCLVAMKNTDSQESQDMEREKSKQVRAAVLKPVTESVSTTQALSLAESSILRTSQPLFPASSYQTPDHKRKISQASIEELSTETTPHKLLQPEAKVQSLQDTFVHTIINELWASQVEIPWAKGRHMFMTYTESVAFPVTANDRTCETSFQYTVRLSDGDSLLGRVRAIADGALRLTTNKASNPKRYGFWSQQKAALAFEVYRGLEFR